LTNSKFGSINFLMKSLQLLSISELFQYCEYFHIKATKNDKKADLLQKLSSIDDKKYLSFQSTLNLEVLLNEEIKFDETNKEILVNNEVLYYFDHKSIPTELVSVHIEKWKIIERIPIKKNQFHLFRKNGKIFFHKNILYYIDTLFYILYEINHFNGTVSKTKEIKHQLSEESKILSFHEDKLWIYDSGKLFIYSLETEKLEKFHEFVENIDIFNLVHLKNEIVFPNSFSRTLGERYDHSILLDGKSNYDKTELRHLKNGNYFVHQDKLYYFGGKLFNIRGLCSNEIHIFDLSKRTHYKERIPLRLNCKLVMFHNESLYFLDNERINYRVQFKRRNYESLLEYNLYSDLTLINNSKEYFVHKFIFSIFTTFDVSEKDKYEIELEERLFVHLLTFLYKGFVDLFQLRMFQMKKIQNVFGIQNLTHQKFLNKFDKLSLKENSYQDFVLICSDKKMIQCHRPVLYLKSDYFQKIFNQNLNLQKFQIHDFPSVMVQKFIRFLYCGRVDDSTDLNNLIELIEVGKYFDSKDFIETIIMIIVNHKLNQFNSFYLFQYCESQSFSLIQLLRFHVIQRIESNYSIEELLRLCLSKKMNFELCPTQKEENNPRKRKLSVEK
jgi:hypothetical protein